MLWVRLFFVDGPWGLCERRGKSYLTRRRRGGDRDEGGSVTGGGVASASLGVVALVLARFVEIPVRIEVAAGP